MGSLSQHTDLRILFLLLAVLGSGYPRRTVLFDSYFFSHCIGSWAL